MPHLSRLIMIFRSLTSWTTLGRVGVRNSARVDLFLIYAGRTVWNALPNVTRSQSNLYSFKRALKTRSFQTTFNIHVYLIILTV